MYGSPNSRPMRNQRGSGNRGRRGGQRSGQRGTARHNSDWELNNSFSRLDITNNYGTSGDGSASGSGDSCSNTTHDTTTGWGSSAPSADYTPTTTTSDNNWGEPTVARARPWGEEPAWDDNVTENRWASNGPSAASYSLPGTNNSGYNSNSTSTSQRTWTVIGGTLQESAVDSGTTPTASESPSGWGEKDNDETGNNSDREPSMSPTRNRNSNGWSDASHKQLDDSSDVKDQCNGWSSPWDQQKSNAYDTKDESSDTKTGWGTADVQNDKWQSAAPADNTSNAKQQSWTVDNNSTCNGSGDNKKDGGWADDPVPINKREDRSASPPAIHSTFQDYNSKWALDADLQSAIARYVVHFMELNNMELKEEEQTMIEQTQNWTLTRLQEEGLVLCDLVGEQGGTYYSMQELIFRPIKGGRLPFSTFAVGDMLTLSRKHPNEPPKHLTTVLRKTPISITLVAKTIPRDLDRETWRVDRALSIIPYARMEKAMLSLCADIPPPMPVKAEVSVQQPGWEDSNRVSSIKQIGRRDVPLFPGTALRDILVSSDSATLAAKSSGLFDNYPRMKDWLESNEDEQAILGPLDNGRSGSSTRKLNISQLAGIKMALRNRFSLIVGPPGTGKTTTTIQLVRIVRELTNAEIPILLCAKTNVAVDNLLSGLVDAGVRAIRVGTVARVRPDLQQATFDAAFERHPDRGVLRRMQEDLAKARFKAARNGPDDQNDAKDAFKHSKSRAHAMTKAIARDVLGQAEVVCATAIGAGTANLTGLSFPLVVIDEGSQCTEPECLIPLTKGAHQAVIVGDHCQLPPTIMSREASVKGLSFSMFDRLMRLHVPSVLLDVQYRMHPAISSFPSEVFYSGRLKDGVQLDDRSVPQLPTLPGLPGSGTDRVVTPPLLFLDLSLSIESRTNAGSVKNEREALLVIHMLHDLLKRNPQLSLNDIGIITPYAEQRRVLTEAIESDPELGGSADVLQANGRASQDIRRQEQNLSMSASPQQQQQQQQMIEVHTVDGFQGREKEVIIMSTVRANYRGAVGFLDDWRRMNVAITRARSLLVIVGSSDTLNHDDHWEQLIKHMTTGKHSAFIDGEAYLDWKEGKTPRR